MSRRCPSIATCSCRSTPTTASVGLGEAGTWGFLEAAEQVVAKFAHYLVGQDPLRIEHHWQYLYRSTHFRGAAIMGALSAIDIALWDIAGKHFGVPVYALLGGKTRNKARVYYHVLGETIESLVEGCRAAKARGFTAVGHLSPFGDEPRDEPYFKTHVPKWARRSTRSASSAKQCGDEVDLCIEIHRRLTPAEAIVLARGIEPFHPLFYEDPILPDNFDAMGLVAENIHIPIATGERLHTIFRIRNAAAARRGPVRPTGRVHVRRDHRSQESGGAGGSELRRRGAAQSARSGQHGGVRSARGVYSQFRHPGVSDRRGPAAQERDHAAPR